MTGKLEKNLRRGVNLCTEIIQIKKEGATEERGGNRKYKVRETKGPDRLPAYTRTSCGNHSPPSPLCFVRLPKQLGDN